jgi:hypothetical protein
MVMKVSNMNKVFVRQTVTAFLSIPILFGLATLVQSKINDVVYTNTFPVFHIFSSNPHNAIVEPKEVFKKEELKSVPIIQSGVIKQVSLSQVSNIPIHTDKIGTSDEPTIDGGIVNAADGIQVNYFLNTSIKKVKEAKKVKAEDIKNQSNLSIENTHIKNTNEKDSLKLGVKEVKTDSKLQDNWATSGRVKRLLKEAASDGKLSYVLNKIDQKGLPASVATVPMIESSYNEFVTSNKGAAGAWQLMPKTAKDYGVSTADRYKLAPSTEAALTLLNDLHKRFGSWSLAFAAYNAGEKRVQDAIKKSPNAKTVQDLDLPKETKDYVSRIMAVNKAMESL